MNDPHHHSRGISFGVIAYLLWGVFPIYFKMLAHITPIEVIAWRAVWSFVLLSAVLTVRSQWGRVADCFRSPRKALMLLMSATAIVSNWGFFVYAMATDQVLQSSLAYFINPLISIMLGVAFLRERMNRLQVVSIALAGVGVVIMTWSGGQIPALALILGVSFGMYGLLRKLVDIDSVTGLAVETGFASPLAIMLLIYLSTHSELSVSTSHDFGLLALMGPLTLIPLLMFNTAARRLRLATVGMLQYITPTMHFLLAVFLYQEPFAGSQLVSFAFIWLAVAIYLIDLSRRKEKSVTLPEAGVEALD